MQFLTLRHSTARGKFPRWGAATAEAHCGPYNGYGEIPNEDCRMRSKAVSVSQDCGGRQPCFSESHPRDWFYGFISWDQFYEYWGSDDLIFSYFEKANFVVFEYDLPENLIISDKTQAVAPIHQFTPVTCYNFEEI